MKIEWTVSFQIFERIANYKRFLSSRKIHAKMQRFMGVKDHTLNGLHKDQVIKDHFRNKGNDLCTKVNEGSNF